MLVVYFRARHYGILEIKKVCIEHDYINNYNDSLFHFLFFELVRIILLKFLHTKIFFVLNFFFQL